MANKRICQTRNNNKNQRNKIQTKIIKSSKLIKTHNTNTSIIEYGTDTTHNRFSRWCYNSNDDLKCIVPRKTKFKTIKTKIKSL